MSECGGDQTNEADAIERAHDVIDRTGPRSHPSAPLSTDLYTAAQNARRFEESEQWPRAEAAWTDVANNAAGVSDGFVLRARVALHRVRHCGPEPDRAHPRHPGVSPLAGFVLARLKEEEHEALLMMEVADAWWRLDKEGHLYGSMDALSWRRPPAIETIGSYGVSQAPIQTIRKVDLMRALVLGADRDGSRSQQVRAIANLHRDHADFRPGWFQYAGNTWLSATDVGLLL